MELQVNELIMRDYGLEILGGVLAELGKIRGFDNFVMLDHAHKFLLGAHADNLETNLKDETKKSEYDRMKVKIDDVLSLKKKSLTELLDIEMIMGSLNGE